jgi:hypothetical protein
MIQLGFPKEARLRKRGVGAVFEMVQQRALRFVGQSEALTTRG